MGPMGRTMALEVVTGTPWRTVIGSKRIVFNDIFRTKLETRRRPIRYVYWLALVLSAWSLRTVSPVMSGDTTFVDLYTSTMETILLDVSAI